MLQISGVAPEHLPLAEPIPEVKKKLKGTSRKFLALDKSKPKPKKKASE